MVRSRNKRSRHIYKILPAVLLAAAAAFIFFDKQQPKPQPAKQVSAKAVVAPTKVAFRGLPLRLKIAAIAVDAPVEYLGLTKDGDVASPNDVAYAGWYKFGPMPGDEGTSVIDGHVVGLRGQPGVFKNLIKLQAGDVIQVMDAKGNSATFSVRLIKTYKENEQPAEVFNSGAGTHLNIITCSGDWDAANHRYLERLVVFTDLLH